MTIERAGNIRPLRWVKLQPVPLSIGPDFRQRTAMTMLHLEIDEQHCFVFDTSKHYRRAGYWPPACGKHKGVNICECEPTIVGGTRDGFGF